MSSALLEVEDLAVTLPGPGSRVRPVREVSMSIERGEIVGVAGESGSGKTLTALAISRLLPRGGEAEAGRLEFDGHDLLSGSGDELRRVLGTGMAIVLQDPMSSLNPARRVGGQMIEAVRAHRGLSRPDAMRLAASGLEEMRIDQPDRRLRQYPHELSGGMRQRTMLAMGLMSEPKLLIADEPTTALDVTVQAQVIDLIAKLNREHGTAVLLVSHNIALLSEVCDRVLIMYAGRIVEDLTVDRLLEGPSHPYTQALIAAVPDLDTDRDAPLRTVPGGPPPATEIPPGCAFAPRCPIAEQACRELAPPLEGASDHELACWVNSREEGAA